MAKEIQVETLPWCSEDCPKFTLDINTCSISSLVEGEHRIEDYFCGNIDICRNAVKQYVSYHGGSQDCMK